MTIKRKRFLPLLQNSKHMLIFMLINIYLIIGVAGLWISIFFMFGHLNKVDSFINYCIPGLVLGISSGIIYFIGYQSMVSEQQNKRGSYKFNK